MQMEQSYGAGLLIREGCSQDMAESFSKGMDMVLKMERRELTSSLCQREATNYLIGKPYHRLVEAL